MSSGSSILPNTTYQQPHRALPFRLLNWIGDRFKLDRFLPLNLTEDSLLEVAEGLTGLSDWGDPDFRVPLQKLLAALATEAQLNLVGRYYFRQYFIRLLVNRLQLEADWKRHPAILQVPIERPLFVVGMFRSGTSFLHNLLAEDPHSRWLHVWEALYPSPPPDPHTWQQDPRLQQTIDHIQFQDSLAPNFSTAHHIDPKRPAECSRLFEHSFVGHLFDFRAEVTTYSHWLWQQDLTTAYRYYRQQLQLLSWRWPGHHWVLKAPAHLFALDTLLQTFPDACIIYLHRDPLKVLPSCCSLSTIGRSRFSDRVNLSAIGAHWLEVLAEVTDRAMQVCASRNSAQFYHLNYQHLLQSPQQVIRQIYEYFGYPWTSQMEQNLQAWIAGNPQHKHGIHRYSLEQFGLTTAAVTQKFATYYEQTLIEVP